MQIKSIEFVESEYLLITYLDKLFFDVYNLFGVLLLRKYLSKEIEDKHINITSIDKVLMNKFAGSSMIVVMGQAEIYSSSHA